MHKLIKTIPNLITFANILAGLMAILNAINGTLLNAAYFILIGIFLDFFDGFFARLLKAQSSVGKQLDSLADVISFGVAPGFILFKLIYSDALINWEEFSFLFFKASFGFLVIFGAAYRLARFNIDTRQTSTFIGLPTPSMALVVASYPLILNFSGDEMVLSLIKNEWFLMTSALLLTILMNAEIKLISLKLTSFSLRKNRIQYIFLAGSLTLLLWKGIIAIPLIIGFYIILSIVYFTIFKGDKKN